RAEGLRAAARLLAAAEFAPAADATESAFSASTFEGTTDVAVELSRAVDRAIALVAEGAAPTPFLRCPADPPSLAVIACLLDPITTANLEISMRHGAAVQALRAALAAEQLRSTWLLPRSGEPASRAPTQGFDLPAAISVELPEATASVLV